MGCKKSKEEVIHRDDPGKDVKEKQLERREAAKTLHGKCNDGPQKSDREY